MKFRLVHDVLKGICPVFSYILRQYETFKKQFSRDVFLFIYSFVCFDLIGVVIAIPKSKAI